MFYDERVKLPLVLAFVATTTAVAIATSCQSGSGDDTTCELHCVLVTHPVDDAGVPIDATCPECADPSSLECPTGCEAIG